MTLMPMNFPAPTLRRFTLVAAMILLPIGAFALGAHAYDPRLDDADAALVKAEALLEASDPGTTDVKAQREFEKFVSKAIVDIENARTAIQDAEASVP